MCPPLPDYQFSVPFSFLPHEPSIFFRTFAQDEGELRMVVLDRVQITVYAKVPFNIIIRLSEV